MNTSQGPPGFFAIVGTIAYGLGIVFFGLLGAGIAVIIGIGAVALYNFVFRPSNASARLTEFPNAVIPAALGNVFTYFMAIVLIANSLRPAPSWTTIFESALATCLMLTGSCMGMVCAVRGIRYVVRLGRSTGDEESSVELVKAAEDAVVHGAQKD